MRLFVIILQVDTLRHHELGIINRKPPLQWCTPLQYFNKKTIFQEKPTIRLQTFPGELRIIIIIIIKFPEGCVHCPPWFINLWPATLFHFFNQFNLYLIAIICKTASGIIALPISDVYIIILRILSGHFVTKHKQTAANKATKYTKNNYNNNNNRNNIDNNNNEYSRNSAKGGVHKTTYDDSYKTSKERLEADKNNEVYKFVSEPWPSGSGGGGSVTSQHNHKSDIKLANNLDENSNVELTALVSFPGSGNTWLRYLLQQATGR